ncbi:hypothetical protein [Candidatus Synchoanobacter obligatus]|uniref:Uncharacterized protein n=1 Tax=Candidatus Synchoanobacter obligatus TaxID=2919597 RepID=A0ABT1L3X4_9GAMM|nr:hypothetical protein [Candidatus Synchoanobacter obligatus]MCP8351892.1 hypothetical protein [Candidatus Synchoanobacter obligatus]
MHISFGNYISLTQGNIGTLTSGQAQTCLDYYRPLSVSPESASRCFQNLRNKDEQDEVLTDINILAKDIYQSRENCISFPVSRAYLDSVTYQKTPGLYASNDAQSLITALREQDLISDDEMAGYLASIDETSSPNTQLAQLSYVLHSQKDDDLSLIADIMAKKNRTPDTSINDLAVICREEKLHQTFTDATVINHPLVNPPANLPRQRTSGSNDSCSYHAFIKGLMNYVIAHPGEADRILNSGFLAAYNHQTTNDYNTPDFIQMLRAHGTDGTISATFIERHLSPIIRRYVHELNSQLADPLPITANGTNNPISGMESDTIFTILANIFGVTIQLQCSANAYPVQNFQPHQLPQQLKANIPGWINIHYQHYTQTEPEVYIYNNYYQTHFETLGELEHLCDTHEVTGFLTWVSRFFADKDLTANSTLTPKSSESLTPKPVSEIQPVAHENNMSELVAAIISSLDGSLPQLKAQNMAQSFLKAHPTLSNLTDEDSKMIKDFMNNESLSPESAQQFKESINIAAIVTHLMPLALGLVAPNYLPMLIILVALWLGCVKTCDPESLVTKKPI